MNAKVNLIKMILRTGKVQYATALIYIIVAGKR